MVNLLFYLWVVSAALATTTAITVPQQVRAEEEELKLPELVEGRLPPKPEVYLPQHDAAIQRIIVHLPAATEHHPAATVVKASKSEEDGHKHISEGGHHEHKGGASSEGHESEEHHEEGQEGEEGKEKHVVKTEEEAGKKTSDDDEGHYGSHHDFSQGTAYDGRHRAQARYKKVGYTKGYRGRYHKDEFHKLDKHWSNHHEKGKFANFGQSGQQYHKQLKVKDKGKSKKGGSEGDHYAKKKQHGGGHHNSDHKGHHSEGGHSSHHSHDSQYKKRAK